MKLKYGKEVQSVIAKDVQFHPVNDRPLHFDLYRVDEHQTIRIEIPVTFRNHEEVPASSAAARTSQQRPRPSHGGGRIAIPEERSSVT